MSEFEAQNAELFGMVNQNHDCYATGAKLVLMRESQARELMERALRKEHPTDFDRRVDNVRRALPYIGAALLAIVSLMIGQTM